ncbi:hypothetical protein AUEXF2481DRAFT_42633 [Aureobasidium subglaciale EXF-2481]|uniref:Zn(2)-C6 fungal-type domain-containing protein n=1 Tax=Aureobasidium subglaciale (strain EXF-2481) TaxID=1043005 RepID=A0A074Y561_AURSE|nr:uncharacterized protein AUEXF2481DRAFT_42633 [Aureobasidium subglaciale EXF-2481]KEQ92933.1 hypothetical protein AUEXF2481DRAFT_42633 [Aureobasidium subglaciale EXF-2481]
MRQCDGKKPACSNCAKRNVQNCTYDLEPNQSRVAAYKQKIEQQMSTIRTLEDEISRLKYSPMRPEGMGRLPVAHTLQSSTSPGGVPMRDLLNPAPEPNPSSFGYGSNGPGAAPNPAPPPRDQMSRMRDIQHNLEIENRSLKELILLLNSVVDREIAQQMAQEINIHGASDDVLSRAQHLVAMQVRRPLLTNLQHEAKGKSQRPPGRSAEKSWP